MMDLVRDTSDSINTSNITKRRNQSHYVSSDLRVIYNIAYEVIWQKVKMQERKQNTLAEYSFWKKVIANIW